MSLPISVAWDYFGERNGVPSLDQMRSRVSHYRKRPLGTDEDPEVGCIFLRDVRFFPEGITADPPLRFSPSVVQGKGYDLAVEGDTSYFDDLLQRLLGYDVGLDLHVPWRRAGPMFGDPRLSPNRLGQQAFQAVVLGAYGRRCAISGDRIRPVLQAAHIRPVTFGGEHRMDNGLLLRSDVHTLFDQGYLGVDPRHRLLVSPRLRDEFGNGEQFYDRARQPIGLPTRRADRPSAEFLQWHLDTVFKAS